MPLFSSAASAAPSFPDVATSTGTSLWPRVLDHFTSDCWGSRSRMKTRSPASCAATATEEAIVLFPDPPFCVTNAIVRMLTLSRWKFCFAAFGITKVMLGKNHRFEKRLYCYVFVVCPNCNVCVAAYRLTSPGHSASHRIARAGSIALNHATARVVEIGCLNDGSFQDRRT